jgi:four helix bundle protein
MRNDKDNLIVKLTFEFALEILSFSEEIRKTNRFEMASQIFRSGTSIGANIREAKTLKAKLILSTSLKSQQRKQMNYNFG